MIATLALDNIANAPTIKASEGDIMSSTSLTAQSANTSAASSQMTLSLEQIKQRIADVSQEYGLDYDQLSSVIQCESQFKVTYGDHGLAFGIAQFHKATFNEYCQGNYYDTDDQLNCMAKMFSIGQAKQWSCFKKLYTAVIFDSPPENGEISMAGQ